MTKLYPVEIAVNQVQVGDILMGLPDGVELNEYGTREMEERGLLITRITPREDHIQLSATWHRIGSSVGGWLVWVPVDQMVAVGRLA